MDNIKKRVDNTSGYTGVKQAKSGKWVAQISYDNKRLHLGSFYKLEDAIESRHKAEQERHKDFNGELIRKDYKQADLMIGEKDGNNE